MKPPAAPVAALSLRHKWRTLLLLCLAEFLGMTVWFSASAVVPALTAAWTLDDSGRAWLTLSVQIGFVAGAFGSALLNVSDRRAHQPAVCRDGAPRRGQHGPDCRG